MKIKSASCLLSLLFPFAAAAANFTVSPTTVSNNYTGSITFHITGLSPGETVQIQQFYDANSNGLVDAGELAVRSDLVTDGNLKLIAGATNLDAVRDEDGVADGAISSSFRFATTPDLAREVGQYILHFSSPSNNFTAHDVVFNVTSPTYPQNIQGTVLSGGVGVPNALVELLDSHSVDGTGLVTGAPADGSGHYSLEAPPGSYQVIAIHSNYVGNFSTFPIVTLGAGATIMTNLDLTAADSSVSGTLVDSTNFSLPALPGAQLLVFSSNNLFTISVADTNGNFSVPVTANNVWTVRPAWQSASARGYMALDPGFEANFSTFSGPYNFAYIVLQHATSLIYGTVADNHGNPIPGITLGAGDGSLYDGAGFSSTNGAYSMVFDQGGGFIEVQNSAESPADAYLFGGTSFGLGTGQTESVNVTGYLATARFRSSVTDDSGAPVTNLFVFASSDLATSTGNTGADGLLDMPVFAGSWNLVLPDVQDGLIFPVVPAFVIVDGVNYTNNIVARRVTGTISGYVHGSDGSVISNMFIRVTNSVGTTNFVIGTQTDASGNYSIPVFDGTWNVSVNADYLSIAGYVPVDATNVTVPPDNAVANFIAGVVPPPQILTTSLFDGIVNNSYFGQLTATNGSGFLQWSVVSGALPPGIALDVFGDLSGAPTNVGLFDFVIGVSDSRGSNDTRALSINVQPASLGPLQISTSALSAAAVGCAYSNLLQATGGYPPYSWSLGSGSDPLPDALTLSPGGVISGIPSASIYANLDIQVTDNQGGQVSVSLGLNVNTSLQYAPGPLPNGSVGTPYYGQLFTSGGAQPQVWSLVSGSLPPSLSLDPPTGAITGTPTTVGVYSFTLRVSDSCSSLDIATSITNYSAPQILPATLPVASLGMPYTAQLQAGGGLQPYYWYTYDSLPGGLVLNQDGSITGTPYTISSITFTAQLSDSAGGVASLPFLLVSTDLPVLDMMTFSPPAQAMFRVTGTSGASYTLQYANNATNWVDLFTTNAPSDIFFLTDTNATDSSRVYQLKVN